MKPETFRSLLSMPQLTWFFATSASYDCNTFFSNEKVVKVDFCSESAYHFDGEKIWLKFCLEQCDHSFYCLLNFTIYDYNRRCITKVTYIDA